MLQFQNTFYSRNPNSLTTAYNKARRERCESMIKKNCKNENGTAMNLFNKGLWKGVTSQNIIIQLEKRGKD